MNIYLIRHGLTTPGEEGRYQGFLDESLSDKGRAQLTEAPQKPSHVYVSPAKRARETASILFPCADQQNAGKRVFVWTVNESDTIKKLIALNVNAILTNDPILCKSITDEYSNDTINLIRRIQNVFIYM